MDIYLSKMVVTTAGSNQSLRPFQKVGVVAAFLCPEINHFVPLFLYFFFFFFSFSMKPHSPVHQGFFSICPEINLVEPSHEIMALFIHRKLSSNVGAAIQWG